MLKRRAGDVCGSVVFLQGEEGGAASGNPVDEGGKKLGKGKVKGTQELFGEETGRGSVRRAAARLTEEINRFTI